MKVCRTISVTRSPTAAPPRSAISCAPVSAAGRNWRSGYGRIKPGRSLGRREYLLYRPVTLDCNPVARAGVRPVIPHRVVLDAAIVPERDRILAPAEAALEQRVGHVLVQIVQDAGALVARDAVDVARKTLVDVERLAPGHGVRAHDRVIGPGIALLVLDAVILVLAAV